MASEQSMVQAITQTAIIGAREVVMAVREAEITIDNTILIQKVLRMVDPNLKQPMFYWKMLDKTMNYVTLK